MGPHAGEHFVAVLAAQQSVLEGVLLKRRIMGPSWLSLARPTRTDEGAQARSHHLPSIYINPQNTQELSQP